VLADSTGQVQNRTFRYADLSSIYRVAIPALSEQGITVLHPNCQAGDRQRAMTLLAGHDAMIEVWHDFDGSITYETVKGLGAVYTYLNRYQLRGLTSVAGDDDPDNDPSTKAGNLERPEPRAPRPQHRPEPRQPAPSPQGRQREPEPPKRASEPPPAANTSSDDDVPDNAVLVAGSATSLRINEALIAAGVDPAKQKDEMKALVLQLTGVSLGGAQPFTYGHARDLLKKLAAAKTKGESP
jgi:hypothetical protein